jgi:hypothetical protein
MPVTSMIEEKVSPISYRAHMTAEAVSYWDIPSVPVFPPETTPAGIRDALIDEERAEFEQAYRKAMTEATRTLDLAPVLEVLRNYHRIAVMTQHQGPEAHRRRLDQVAHALRTGEAPEGSVSEEVMMARLNERLGQ